MMILLYYFVIYRKQWQSSSQPRIELTGPPSLKMCQHSSGIESGRTLTAQRSTTWVA